MKPTQEQVIAWAREAGVIECDCCLPFWPEDDQPNWEIFFERLVDLAYEAGRKDENEACAKVCEDSRDAYDGNGEIASWCAHYIRARREQ